MQSSAFDPQRPTSPAPAPLPPAPQGPQPLDPQALDQVSGGAKGGKPIGPDGWSWI